MDISNLRKNREGVQDVHRPCWIHRIMGLPLGSRETIKMDDNAQQVRKYQAAFWATVVVIAVPLACNREDCTTFEGRYEEVSEGSFECGESLGSVAVETERVVECLATRKKSCTAASGQIATSSTAGVALYGLIVHENCKVTILTGESPGQTDIAFAERVCADFAPSMATPYFTVKKCGLENTFPTCD